MSIGGVICLVYSVYTDERPGQAAQPVVVVLVGVWLGLFQGCACGAWENMMGLVACFVGLCALGND